MSKTYFISGHRNITEEEFIKHYEPVLWNKINESDVSFVVGDCVGADDMAQKYLKSMGVKEVTVYHMFDNPRHNAGFTLVGGFNSDVERDSAMTKASDADIAWVRDFNQKSGTKDNLERRKWYNDTLVKGYERT